MSTATQALVRPLSASQRRAIALICGGRSSHEVAAILGVPDAAVNTWRTEDPEFIAALNRVRTELWDTQTERLRSLMRPAVDALAEDLRSDDAERRYRAAIQVLKLTGLSKGSLQPKGNTDERDVAMELASDRKVREILESLTQAEG